MPLRIHRFFRRLGAPLELQCGYAVRPSYRRQLRGGTGRYPPSCVVGIFIVTAPLATSTNPSSKPSHSASGTLVARFARVWSDPNPILTPRRHALSSSPRNEFHTSPHEAFCPRYRLATRNASNRRQSVIGSMLSRTTVRKWSGCHWLLLFVIRHCCGSGRP